MITPKNPITRSDEQPPGPSGPSAAASLPFDEGEVDARVAAGELVRLDIEGKVPVRSAVLAQLRANASRSRGGRQSS